MFETAMFEGFYGLGVFYYVGSGALVFGGTSFGQYHIANPHIDIWVQVRASI
jgi:hypothetical protein